MEPSRDNQPKIANDGRNVSLDPRLAHLDPPTNCRAAAVAEQIMRIDRDNADRVYLHPDTRQPLALRRPRSRPSRHSAQSWEWCVS